MGQRLQGTQNFLKFGTLVDISTDGAIIAADIPSLADTTRFDDDITTPGPGMVMTYQWSEASWKTLGTANQAKAPGDRFGHTIELNTDGSRLAIGAGDWEQGGRNNMSGYAVVYNLRADWTPTGGDLYATDDLHQVKEVCMPADGKSIGLGVGLDIDSDGFENEVEYQLLRQNADGDWEIIFSEQVGILGNRQCDLSRMCWLLPILMLKSIEISAPPLLPVRQLQQLRIFQ